jgi:hypothetical protein
MSCRSGPLRLPPRKQRPVCGDPDSRGHFVGVYTGLAGMIVVGPTVGREMNDPGERPGRYNLFHPDKLTRRVNARSTRSGPVRQNKQKSLRNQRRLFLTTNFKGNLTEA